MRYICPICAAGGGGPKGKSYQCHRCGQGILMDYYSYLTFNSQNYGLELHEVLNERLQDNSDRHHV